MNEPVNIIEIPGLLYNNTSKKIIFAKEGFSIEKPGGFLPATFIPAENIAGFRFGVNWISGYVFTIGRQYIIQVLDTQNNVSSIKFNSIYKLRRDTYYQLWSDTINQLWVNYFVNNLNYYYDLYSIKQEFDLGEVKFLPLGISWQGGNLFWDEIALSNYKTYFMIHHKRDLKKKKSCNFKNDWNALILQSLLKKIIQEQNAFRDRAV